MILSIDVGIRNLAMCMLDETSNLIVQWDVSGVPPEHKDGLFVSLRDHLDDKPWVLQADTVLSNRYSYGRRLPGLRSRASHTLTPSINLPAPGRRHTLYVLLRVCRVLCF